MKDGYIRRGDLDTAIKEWWANDNDSRSFAEVINSVPTVDVEPVRRGRWNYWERLVGITEIWGYECSECMYETVDSECYNLPKFCPKCGAKMNVEPPKEEDNAE